MSFSISLYIVMLAFMRVEPMGAKFASCGDRSAPHPVHFAPKQCIIQGAIVWYHFCLA